jgi:hypothetical protein
MNRSFAKLVYEHVRFLQLQIHDMLKVQRSNITFTGEHESDWNDIVILLASLEDKLTTMQKKDHDYG